MLLLRVLLKETFVFITVSPFWWEFERFLVICVQLECFRLKLHSDFLSFLEYYLCYEAWIFTISLYTLVFMQRFMIFPVSIPVSVFVLFFLCITSISPVLPSIFKPTLPFQITLIPHSRDIVWKFLLLFSG